MPDGTMGAMSDAEARALFARDGMLVLPGFFSTAAAAEIARWTVDLQDAPEEVGRHWVYWENTRTGPVERVIQRIENFCPFHTGFDQLLRHDRLSAAVSNVLGDTALLFKEKINFKMPRAPGFTPHQDQAAGWSRYAPFFVTAMVTIDATTVENGCLEMVAGYHDRGLIGDLWKPLTAEQMRGMDFISVPTAPGDAIFFDSYAPHRSAPNSTTQPRRVLYITYNRASEGDWREQYYADKRRSFPPDCEREAGKVYEYKV